MNIIAVIILLAILAEVSLNALADFLNLKMLRSDIPKTFQELYDPDRYRESQAYLKVNTRFGWFVSVFDVMSVIVFWFGRGFPWLDRCVFALFPPADNGKACGHREMAVMKIRARNGVTTHR